MRQLALAVVLACMLSGVARAGEIPSSDRTPPHGSHLQVSPGEIPTGDRTGEIPSSDRTGVALSTGATAPEASMLLTIILTLLTIGR
jgi:hypothetical protein